MEKKIHTLASLCCPSFSAHLDEVLLRNGEVGKRLRIDHPEAAAVIPFISDTHILMVRQFRYALGKETVEIPAGKMDPGESPEDCARRELLEETGYRAGSIKPVLTYAPTIGYSNELIHIFSGLHLEQVDSDIDEREITSIERIGLEEIGNMVRQGEITDGKTLLGLALLGLIRL